jgi:hypothetical protein
LIDWSGAISSRCSAAREQRNRAVRRQLPQPNGTTTPTMKQKVTESVEPKANEIGSAVLTDMFAEQGRSVVGWLCA